MTDKASTAVVFLPKKESGGAFREKSVYLEGNAMEGLTAERGEPMSVYADARFEPFSLDGTVLSPEQAYLRIVESGGASLGFDGVGFSFVRDELDQRLIADLTGRQGTFKNGLGFAGVAGFPEIEYPQLVGGDPVPDADQDGMSDAWELQQFGTTGRDGTGDYDVDGYTDVEAWLWGIEQGKGVTATPMVEGSPTASPSPSASPTMEPTVTPTGGVTPEVTATGGGVEPTSTGSPTATVSVPTASPTVTPVPTSGQLLRFRSCWAFWDAIKGKWSDQECSIWSVVERP
jgi:hypothetical protein